MMSPGATFFAVEQTIREDCTLEDIDCLFRENGDILIFRDKNAIAPKRTAREFCAIFRKLATCIAEVWLCCLGWVFLSLRLLGDASARVTFVCRNQSSTPTLT